MLDLTEQEILLRLDDFEDSFVERKTASDSHDWLKTAVAFANSTPIGYPSVMFIGVKNDGTIEGLVNVDSLQKSFARKLSKAYPPIYYLTKVLKRDDTDLLAVVIPGSDKRPHFAGHAYVREGAQSVPASEEMFSRLVAGRNSMTFEILKWRDKLISIRYPPADFGFRGADGPLLVRTDGEGEVLDCNQFYVTLRSDTRGIFSYPLEALQISFDHENARLQLRIMEGYNS